MTFPQTTMVNYYSGTRPKLIWRARSTRAMVSGPSRPQYRPALALSMVRIWLSKTTESLSSPHSGALTSTRPQAPEGGPWAERW